MEDDWDLHAVVRGCAAVTSTTATNTATATAVALSSSSSSSTGSSSVSSSSAGFVPPMFPIFEPKALNSSIAQLHELLKPSFFFPKSHFLPSSFQLQASSSSSSSPLSSSSLSYSSSSVTKSAQTQTQTQQKQHHLSGTKHSQAGSLTTPRSKRRKNQLKKVCQVPAEALSSDIWAWRKYGQKPIKGSPYPRGYYRCSSSKMCLARKQVERDRSDPTMFIVTYTSEHNHPAPTHRNSLSGSTRQKSAAAAEDSDKAPTKPVSPATSSGVEEELASQGTTRSESKEQEENEFGLSDMELSDDFFEGLDELQGSPAPPHAAAGDCFVDPFSPGIEFPGWVANDASSAAGGI